MNTLGIVALIGIILAGIVGVMAWMGLVLWMIINIIEWVKKMWTKENKIIREWQRDRREVIFTIGAVVILLWGILSCLYIIK